MNKRLKLTFRREAPCWILSATGSICRGPRSVAVKETAAPAPYCWENRSMMNSGIVP